MSVTEAAEKFPLDFMRTRLGQLFTPYYSAEVN